jgi:microcystin-dependent protein
MTEPTPLIAEIRTFAAGFAPPDWAACDGRLLPIAEYQPLFSLIGWRYGGDGWSTFALPDLRGECAEDLIPAIALDGVLVRKARSGNPQLRVEL